MSYQVVHYQTQVKFYHIVSEMLVHSSFFAFNTKLPEMEKLA